MGGGPAGLTAGMYGSRSGLKTLVLERLIPGGCITEAIIIENYPGFFDGIRGSDLDTKLMRQCEKPASRYTTWKGFKS